MTPPPANPKLYHIVHVDRLASIVADGKLLCDAVMAQRAGTGTTVGMNHIKERRLALPLESQPGLHVGECVPFYFCPRSVMLYLLSRGNHPDLAYRGGQEPIVHLEFDLHRVVEWAEAQRLRWAFTLSNAGAFYVEDRRELASLGEIDWIAMRATDWRNPDIKQAKQAEFLLEREAGWTLVERIGVISNGMAQRTATAIAQTAHHPRIEIKRDWYY
jgi:ssDNA thymidine ADP-ribosyltransferase, DarT